MSAENRQSTQKAHEVSTTWEDRHKKNAAHVPLEVSCLMERTRSLHQNLSSRIIGQDEAIKALVCSYARLLSGLRDPARPLLTILLLGPTGVGKTETAKALAETLFGSEGALTRVNCEEYAHGHEISKLLGSPPGYVGSDIRPLLSQDRIDAFHRLILENRGQETEGETVLADGIFDVKEDRFLSILLFDEIEKAHPLVWNALLGILEGGTLTLGDNSTTDLTRSIIVMTSNVGGREMNEILERRSIGFYSQNEQSLSGVGSTKETVMSAALGVFPLEFLNRFDEILVYSPLERKDLDLIFRKFLSDIHERALKQAGVPLLIQVSPAAREMIVERGTDLRFGARPLRRVMEKELVDPLSRLIASQKLSPGDVVEVEEENNRLVFYRRPRASDVVIA